MRESKKPFRLSYVGWIVLLSTVLLVLITLFAPRARAATDDVQYWRAGHYDYQWPGDDGAELIGDWHWMRIKNEVEDEDNGGPRADQDIAVATGRFYLWKTVRNNADAPKGELATYDTMLGVENLSLYIAPWVMTAQDERSGELPIGLKYVHSLWGGYVALRGGVGPWVASNQFTNDIGERDSTMRYKVSFELGVDYQGVPDLLEDDLFQLGFALHARAGLDSQFVVRPQYNAHYLYLDLPFHIATKEEQPEINALSNTFWRINPRVGVNITAENCWWGVTPFVGYMYQKYDDGDYTADWKAFGGGLRVKLGALKFETSYYPLTKDDKYKPTGDTGSHDILRWDIGLSYEFR